MSGFKPSITDLEKSYVNDALSKGDIGAGEYIPKFEKAWASYNKMDYGVSCNSGTNAIYLALKALKIGPGDEVILPEYTMIATAWAVTYTGATPVFVDCMDDLLMKHPCEDKKIKKGVTKAVIDVPIYGRKTISHYTYFKALGIPVIQDMAEAHGIIPECDIACYSFYGNKILTTGEGGMCLTNNKEWAEEMRRLSNMYMDANRTMLHQEIGHNFRMTNLQAAVGLAQVERIDEILEKRKQIDEWYEKYIPEEYKVINPYIPGAEGVYPRKKRDVLWMYDIDCGEHQEELKAYLKEKGIETRYGFKPMSMQPMYLGEYEDLNAYKWSKRILYLPVWTDMTEEDVKQIATWIQLFEKK